MLHPGSPHDDPTRALRAVLLHLRLGYRIEPRTRRWIADAVAAGAFVRVSGDRWRRELALLWAEQPPAAGAAAIARLGIDRAIDPALALRPRDRRRLAALGRLPAREESESRAFAVLLTWTLDRTDEERGRIAERLGYTGRRRTEMIRIGADRADAAALRRARAPLSTLAVATHRWSAEEAAAIEAGSAPRDRAAFRRARGKAGALRLRIRGADLVRSGLPAGPAIGLALERTWRARVDGRISAAEELAFALEAAR
jgi:hypothetical protein